MQVESCFKIWHKHIQVQLQIKEVQKLIGTHFCYDQIKKHFQQVYNSNDIKNILILFKTLNELMELTKNNLKISMKMKSGRYFLSAVLLYYYPDESECDNQELLKQANKLMTSYLHLYGIKGVKPLNDLIVFVQHVIEFNTLYEEWELVQKNTEIAQMSQSFWVSVAELTQNIDELKSQITMLTDFKKKGETMYEGRDIDSLLTTMKANYDSRKNQFDSGFADLKQKVLSQVKLLNGNEGVKYFESLVPLFIDPSFANNIKEVVHKAFWDSLTSDLTEQKYDKLLTLLNELKYYMALCVPNRHDIHQEINGAIDTDLWKQMLENNAFNNDDIIGFITYVYTKITEWCSAADKANVETKMKDTLAKLEKVNAGEISLPEFITQFIKDSFQYLESIVMAINEYKASDEYKAIKRTFEETLQSKK